MSDYQNLEVWQKAMDLCVEIYNLIEKLPREEKYALSDQMRRSVVSIASNIAEGRGRGSDKEFLHFLSMAMGSKCELETQLAICERLLFLGRNETKLAWQLCDIVGQKLFSLSNAIKRSINKAKSYREKTKMLINSKRKGTAVG